jgi:hypothetical protein
VVVVIVAGGLLWLHPWGSGKAASGPTASAVATAEASGTEVSPSSSAPVTPTEVPTEGVNTSLAPGQEYADLDGLPADAAKAHRLPMAIMVDDQAIARPQSGFTSASIVYQAPTDGNTTRYMMVFQENDAAEIGPARSARPYYPLWAAEYHALFGHVGGDKKSRLEVIPSLRGSIYNMDELSGGSCAYHRVSTRPVPHNDYTSSAVLISCAAKKGYPKTIDKVPGRTFGDDLPAADRPASGSIVVHHKNQLVGYDYDRASNSYRRSVAGQPNIDKSSKQRVSPRNVIVLFQAVGSDPNAEPGYVRPIVNNKGSGDALVFCNGQAITAKWTKKTDTDLTRLTDTSGKEITLVRGQIFIHVVQIGTKIDYSFE